MFRKLIRILLIVWTLFYLGGCASQKGVHIFLPEDTSPRETIRTLDSALEISYLLFKQNKHDHDNLLGVDIDPNAEYVFSVDEDVFLRLSIRNRYNQKIAVLRQTFFKGGVREELVVSGKVDVMVDINLEKCLEDCASRLSIIPNDNISLALTTTLINYRFQQEELP